MSELQAVDSNALPVVPMDQAWGAEGVAQESVLIPRLVLAQDLTEAVKQGKCRPGAILGTDTGEVLAAPGERLEMIPIYTFREWEEYDVEEKANGKIVEKYRGRMRVTRENEHLAVEDYVNGQRVKRVKCLNFFVLLTNRMDGMPYLVSFKKTGMNAGKKLATHFFNSGLKKVAPASQAFSLGAAQKSYEGFTYHAYNVEPSRATTIEEVAKAYHWYQIFTKQEVNVMEETNNG